MRGPGGVCRWRLADVDGGAVKKVRGSFIADPQARGQRAWSNDDTGLYEDSAVLKQTYSQVHEALPLVLRIAARVDPEIAAALKVQTGGWPFYKVKDAAWQLAGLLDSMEEAERILGPVGPKLAAANLHPWIWNAAVNLWDDGHLREAARRGDGIVRQPPSGRFLGVPAKPSAKDLVTQAFLTDPPTAGSPRLRLDDYPDPSPSCTSQHEGVRFFGMGCAQLIRNLATHGAQPDEEIALEQLASLSLLARLVERAKVETV